MRILFLLIIYYPLSVFAQSATADSILISRHTPKKAAIWSSVIPGAGQVYNQLYSPPGNYGAYWKLPLIYASLVGTGKLFYDAILSEKDIRIEYYNRESNSNLISDKWSNYSQADLILLHESAVRKRTMYGLLFGATYLVQVIEASVDAHFLHFDISPSLTMHVQPTYVQQTAGIQLSFSLK